MNYIDKIKKNGVIYAIRGTGSGSSGGGSASEAETAQGVTLTYEPDEETGIQILDKHYGLGAVDTITWTRPAPTADDFQEQEEEEAPVKGPIPVIGEEAEEETISCPLVYVDGEHDIAVYLGSPFVQVDSDKAGVKLLLLIGGSILLDIGIRFEMYSRNSVNFNMLDAESKISTAADQLHALGDDFNDFFGHGNPMETINADQGGGEKGGEILKSAKNADGEEESFEPNVKNLAYMLRGASAMNKITSLGQQAINNIINAMNLTNAGYLSSLSGIEYQQPTELTE